MSLHRRCATLRYSFLSVLLISMFVLVGCGSSPVVIVQGDEPPPARGTLLDPPKELANFTLTNPSGAPVSLDDLRGHPTLVFFGYTNCPDMCPLTMAEWKKVKQNLGDAAADVAYVMISVDPERDTPEAITRFLAGYDPSFMGLRGEIPTIEAIGKDFGVYFHVTQDASNGSPPLVDHSSQSFLLDRDARMHMVYSYGMPAETITRDIRSLLAQGGT